MDNETKDFQSKLYFQTIKNIESNELLLGAIKEHMKSVIILNNRIMDIEKEILTMRDLSDHDERIHDLENIFAETRLLELEEQLTKIKERI